MTSSIAEMDERIAQLQKKYDAQEADQRRIDEKRKQIALPALGDDDPKAQRELDRLTREKNQKALEKENTQFAITAAEQQKQELLQKEREAKQQKDRAELLKLAKQRGSLGKKIDETLDKLAAQLNEHREVTRKMDRFVGGDSGRLPRWRANMTLRSKELHQFFELPVPPTASKAHYAPFAELDRGVMSRKGIEFSQAGNPK